MPRRIEGRGDGLGAQEEGEVDKVEEVEESNLGESDDQRACLPQPPALVLRPR